jgi:hypothetical protein
MKKLITAFALLLTAMAYSQNVTIDYAAWNPSSPPCKLFYPATNVPATIAGVAGNISHLSEIGQTTYSNSDLSVQLQCIYTDNGGGIITYKGTQYRLSYNFKSGYIYNVFVTVASNVNSAGNPSPLLRIDLDAGLNGGSTGCNGPETIVSNIPNVPAVAITSTTFAEVSGFVYAPTANFGALKIAAVPVFNSGTKTLRIQKIRIVETPPGASFNITPITTALTCGSTTPVTFTVNNGANTPGITGYTWNLGSASNGWLYNSVAAPQTISTGTANTLTLTPVCGAVQSNVSATVAANSNNYPTTNAATVSITQPSFSISGNSSLCSGSTSYTLNGLVCNSSILWTPPPSSLGSLNSLTTSPTTLTYGGTSGNFTLMANVTSCGATTPVTLPVHVGAYTSSDYTLSGNNGSTYYCTNQTISFGVSGGAATNHVWTIPPSGWTIVYNGGSYIAVRTPSNPYPPTGTVSVSFTEACGATVTKSKFLAYSSSACNTNDPRFKIYPNPASSYLNVEVDLALPNNSNTHIVGVQLLNQSATLVYNQSYPNNPGNFYQGVQIPVYNQVNGNYTLRVYDGTTWVTYAVVVQH